MNNLISVLLSTLKARITPIWTRIRYWTSWNFIKANILTKIRNALSSIFNVKPRNKDDYYPLFGYLISRRLAHAIVIVVGILCVCYLVWANPAANMTERLRDGERVYSYNSLLLRFAEGDVKIKAKGGYIAYEGNVEKGYVNGSGQLFDEKGNLLYKGNFEQNQYSGDGELYYPIGQLEYNGQFQKNLFEGEGTLYRENGTKKYEGQFSRGAFEGKGTLYDTAEQQVFQGNFHNGELVYTQLLGKSASELADIYTGKRFLYQKDEEWAVILEDIDAFYLQTSDNNSLDDTAKATKVYVGKDTFTYGEYQISTLDELKKILGEPVFEGNSYVTFPEAVGIEWLQKRGKDIPLDVSLENSQLYDDVETVTGYSPEALVYLYVFQVEDVTYTFISSDRNNEFFMYSLEQ